MMVIAGGRDAFQQDVTAPRQAAQLVVDYDQAVGPGGGIERSVRRSAIVSSAHARADLGQLVHRSREGAYVINTQDVPGRRSAGILAWAGLANTYFWLDQ